MGLTKKKSVKIEIETKNYKDVRDVVLVTEAIRVSRGKGKNWQKFKSSLENA